MGCHAMPLTTRLISYNLCHLRNVYLTFDHQVLFTQLLPRKAEDFPRGGKYPKHVILSTNLAYLQSKNILLVGSTFVLDSVAEH